MSLRRALPVVPRADEIVALRAPGPGDLDVISRYIGREDAQAWLSGAEDAEALLAEYGAGWRRPDEPNRLGLTVVVTRTGHDGLVGVLHFEPSGEVLHVAYGVAPNHRRAGVASHALELCATWALDHGFTAVELEIGEDNAPSQAVARRCGFLPTARTREQRLPAGDRWRARVWSRRAGSV